MSTARVLGGRYEVGEVIGRGGMASVHLGRDLRLGRRVAIKILHADLARDPLFQSRFRREAQAVAGLNHPAIVSVYDTGCERAEEASGDGVDVPFIVMEFVAGRSLRDFLQGEGLTLGEAIVHLVGVLHALEFSHRAGVIHRDIKPANVMITPEGGVKVVDFGIARSSDDPDATMTRTQAVLGTAQYLSPEQVRGEIADARSDLYSAGCLLYELLTGRAPFTGENSVSVAYQHVHSVPVPASTHSPVLNPALDSVLVKALAKARKDRFQTARTFAQALQSAAKGLLADDAAEPDTFFNPLPWRSPWEARKASALAGSATPGSAAASTT